MHWLLSIWICAAPGWGECRPHADLPQPSRAVCRAEAVRAEHADPHVLAHCHLRMRDRVSQQPDRAP